MKFIVTFEKQHNDNGVISYQCVDIPGLTGQVGSPTIKSVASLLENKISASVKVEEVWIRYTEGKQAARLTLQSGDMISIVAAPKVEKVTRTRQEIRADVLKRREQEAEEMKARLAAITGGSTEVKSGNEAPAPAATTAKTQKKTTATK